MNDPAQLSLAKAARSLNVHADTLKRWEAQGMLPFAVSRTAGGHRRYSEQQIDDLKQLLLTGSLVPVRPTPVDMQPDEVGTASVGNFLMPLVPWNIGEVLAVMTCSLIFMEGIMLAKDFSLWLLLVCLAAMVALRHLLDGIRVRRQSEHGVKWTRITRADFVGLEVAWAEYERRWLRRADQSVLSIEELVGLTDAAHAPRWMPRVDGDGNLWAQRTLAALDWQYAEQLSAKQPLIDPAPIRSIETPEPAGMESVEQLLLAPWLWRWPHALDDMKRPENKTSERKCQS